MIFLGCLFKKEDENEIIELSRIGISNAVNKFQWNLLDGLINFVELDIINVLPVGTYPNQYSKFFLQNKKWTWKNSLNNIEIGSINIFLLKQYFRYRSVKNEVYKKLEKDKKISNIIIYSTYLPFLKAVYRIDKSISITLIITDLPEYYNITKQSIIKKIIRKINNYFVYRYLQRIDSFVLLTDQMRNKLLIKNRKSIVIEGIADTDGLNNVNSLINFNGNDSKKVLLYSGGLNYQYGIVVRLTLAHRL